MLLDEVYTLPDGILYSVRWTLTNCLPGAATTEGSVEELCNQYYVWWNPLYL